jgi:two-component system phosphate regulon sensor histidine kinase PhoR
MRERIRMRRNTLQGRVLSWFAVVFVTLLVLIALLVRSGVRDALIDQLADDLVDKAALVQLTLDLEGDPQVQIAAQAEVLDARITVIGIDGTVLADSVSDPTTMDDHSDRPEVVAALRGEVGRSSRYSVTTDENRLYIALPPANDRIVRLSVTESKISDDLSALTGTIVSAVALVGLVGSLAAAFAASRISRPIAALTDTADRVAAGSLEVVPRRSTTIELDRLSQAIGRMASDLGRRISESEEQRETLEQVLGALPEGVLLVEPDDRLSYANPPARDLLGPVPERLTGLAPAAVQRAIRNARERGEVDGVVIEMGAPTRIVSVVATPFREDRARVLVVAEDITERHRIEAMRRDFVADASHELKTPIASVLASSEALQLALDRDPERAVGFAAQVESSARRLARIVEDLLDLSRLEASEASGGSCPLDRVVAEEVERLRARAEERGVVVSTDLEPVFVEGARSDWALAVRNLCENAITYTDRGGEVSITLRAPAGSVELEVADTGTGIPTRSLARVFERFYRVDVARSRDTGGTGLGLAIVKHVAERYGGTVSVSSELGRGSRFRVVVPVRTVAEATDRPE